MYHATVKGKNKFDVEWDGKSAEGKLGEVGFSADIAGLSFGKSHWIYKNKSFNVEIVELDPETKEVIVKVNGTTYPVQLKDRYDDLLKSLGMEGGAGAQIKYLKAPMPGLVLDILVNEGDTVEKDTPLLILEAMKMENVIKSPGRAVVKKVPATKGNAVEKSSILIEFQ